MLLIANNKPRLSFSAGSGNRRWEERPTQQLLLLPKYSSKSESRGPWTCVHTFTGVFIFAIPPTLVLGAGPVVEPPTPLADILSQPWHIFTSSRAVLRVWLQLKVTDGKSARSGAGLHRSNLCLRDCENRSAFGDEKPFLQQISLIYSLPLTDVRKLLHNPLLKGSREVQVLSQQRIPNTIAQSFLIHFWQFSLPNKRQIWHRRNKQAQQRRKLFTVPTS